jgi:hypothetical protein
MRLRWLIPGGLFAVVLLCSCQSSRPNLKPPKGPEEYNLPPPRDGRYINPINFPDETLNQQPIDKKKLYDASLPGPAGRRASSFQR